jgi:S1-C subfamily serine protease
MKRLWIFVAAVFVSAVFFALVAPVPAKEGEHGWLGVYVEPVPKKLRKKYDLERREGVYIRAVVKDSPADFADLEEDDIILSLDGKKVRSPSHLRRLLRKKKPGEAAKLEVIHDGRRKKVEVILEEAPRRWQEERMFWVPDIIVWGKPRVYLGVSLQELNEDLARYFQVEPESGVLVTDVEEDSPADKAGLKAGDILIAIDGEDVLDPEDVVDILQEYEEGDEVELTVIRFGKEKRIKVVLEEGKNPVIIRYGWPFFREDEFEEGIFWKRWSPGLDFWIENFHNTMDRFKRHFQVRFRGLWPGCKAGREVRFEWKSGDCI